MTPGVGVTPAGVLVSDLDGTMTRHGVDRARVVRWHLDAGRTVAFAGDGFPDAGATRLVAAELRFARGDLADVLDREGLGFRPFETWSDIARVLLRTPL